MRPMIRLGNLNARPSCPAAAPAGVPQSMVVTPRDVDLLIDRGAHLIGMAVNHAAQPELTPEEIAYLIA